MTLEELFSALNSINGFTGRVAYNHFPSEGMDLPCMLYFCTSTHNYAADNKVYHPIQSIELQLITAQKEPTTEAEVENKLNELELVWNKSEAFLDDEKCLEITYNFDL